MTATDAQVRIIMRERQNARRQPADRPPSRRTRPTDVLPFPASAGTETPTRISASAVDPLAVAPRTASSNTSIDAAGPRNTVRQPSTSANRRTLVTQPRGRIPLTFQRRRSLSISCTLCHSFRCCRIFATTLFIESRLGDIFFIITRISECDIGWPTRC